MTDDSGGPCPLCGGRRGPGTTRFTAELGFGVVVVRGVPATICSQCGADWLSDETAARLERVVDDARPKHSQLHVLSYL